MGTLQTPAPYRGRLPGMTLTDNRRVLRADLADDSRSRRKTCARWNPTVCPAASGHWWLREPQPSPEPLAARPRAPRVCRNGEIRVPKNSKPEVETAGKSSGRPLFVLQPSGAGAAARLSSSGGCRVVAF